MSLIYHITTNENWTMAKATGTYEFCALKTEGFIHASKLEQTVKTANNYFKDKTNLVVLVLDTEKIKSKLVFETPEGRSEEFPHIYGPLNCDAVVGFKKLIQNEAGEFVALEDL